MSAKQVEQVCKFADKLGLSVVRDGFAVLYGTGVRDQDIALATAAYRSSDGTRFAMGSKLLARKRGKTGEDFKWQPILTEAAKMVIDARVAKASAISPSALLFPGWKLAKVSEIVKAVAIKQKWEAGLWWSGSHNVRHGVAVETREAFESKAMAVGGWGCMEAAPTDKLRAMRSAPRRRQSRLVRKGRRSLWYSRRRTVPLGLISPWFKSIKRGLWNLSQTASRSWRLEPIRRLGRRQSERRADRSQDEGGGGAECRRPRLSNAEASTDMGRQARQRRAAAGVAGAEEASAGEDPGSQQLVNTPLTSSQCDR